MASPHQGAFLLGDEHLVGRLDVEGIIPAVDHRQGDFLMELSLTVTVKGDADEQIRFYEYLKKWLVAMVASIIPIYNEWMMTHEAERQLMGNEARLASARYQLETVMSAWEQAYASVL